ncbi:MAG: hypothetical protein OXG44_11145 [Gammaproteobacteria bacterium]|nr:hypothetical protein [Gammaproteobacteria bacterium]
MSDTAPTAEPTPEPTAEQPAPIEGIPVVEEAVEVTDTPEYTEAVARAETAEANFNRLVELAGENGLEIVQRLVDGEWQLDLRRSDPPRVTAAPTLRRSTPAPPKPNDVATMTEKQKAAAYRALKPA